MQNITAPTPEQINEDRGPAVLAVTIVFTAISFVFVSLRIVSRCFIVGRWKWDDWFIILAWAIGFGLSLTICLGVKHGLGRHSSFVAEQDDLPLRKSDYAFSILYNPVLMCTKTSICIFYLSVAENQRFFRWGVWTTLAIVNLAGLALTLVNILQCRPPSAVIGTDKNSNAMCIDIVAIYLASAPVNIFTDLALLLLPMPMLTAMRMPRKQKIILVITFGFGLFVTIIDVIRISYLQSAFETRLRNVSPGNAITSQLLNRDDFPWYAAYSFMFSAVEVHVGIMCASVPALKPLFAKIMPTMLYDTTSQIDNATWRKRKTKTFFRSCLCNWRGETKSSQSRTPAPQYPLYVDSGHSRHTPEETKSNPDGQPNQSLPPRMPRLHAVGSRDFASEPSQVGSPTTIDGRVASPTLRPADVPFEGRPTVSLESDDSSQTPQSSRDGDNHPMDFLEFITTPEMPGGLTRQVTTATTGTLPPTPNPQATFYDFYNVNTRKTMTEMTGRESIFSISAVTILFFLWGFAYGLLEQLNVQFSNVAQLSQVQTVALHSAYYGAYFVSVPTIGQLVLRKQGFKMAFICGLCIYATGALIFWPSAVLVSYPAFLVSNFVVGAGVGIIEVSANSFVALCGPMRYSEARLLFSQAVQAIGTVLSALLSTKALFIRVRNAETLIDAQWTYLAISLFDVALAVIFYYIPIPEADDRDFESVRLKSLPEGERISQDDRRIPRSAYITLGVAVLSMFIYLGAQEVVNTEFLAYVVEVNGETQALDPDDWQLLGYSTFTIGRFVCSGLALFCPPYMLLTFFDIGIVVTSAIALKVRGPAGPAMLVLYEFFQGPIFPLIYSIGLRGLGKHTKWGAVALTAAISGGAIWPIISAAVDNARGAQVSLAVALATAAFGLGHPLYLSLYRPAYRQVDPKLGFGGTFDLKEQEQQEKQSREARHQRRVQQKHDSHNTSPSSGGGEGEASREEGRAREQRSGIEPKTRRGFIWSRAGRKAPQPSTSFAATAENSAPPQLTQPSRARREQERRVSSAAAQSDGQVLAAFEQG